MNALDALDAHLLGAWNADTAGDHDLRDAYTARARGALERLELVRKNRIDEVTRLEDLAKAGKK